MRHLVGCAACALSVRELAGMPSVLALVPIEVLQETVSHDPVPAPLAPGGVSAARRAPRPRITRTALVAAASVVLIASGAWIAMTGSDDARSPLALPPSVVETTAPALPMGRVGAGSSAGWVSMTAVDWGTRLDLTCQYDQPPGVDGAWMYSLVIRTTDGRTEQIATWRAIDGEEMHVTGSTAVAQDAISEVEVRDSAGESVLRLAR